MAQFQRELSRAKQKFLFGLQNLTPFPNPDNVSIVTSPIITFPKDKLLLPNEKNKSPYIRGIVPTDTNINSLYIVTSDNSKIKQLDLTTSLLKELSSYSKLCTLYSILQLQLQFETTHL